MAITEKAIENLEQYIPEQAEMALKQAYLQALGSGSNVLVCEDGNLVEKHPDGTQKILKKIQPPMPITPGLKWEIK